MNIEITKKIEGYENYTISSFGNVFELVKKRFLIPSIQNDKGKHYYYINLRNEDGRKKYYIHRLIALSFIPNPNNENCIDHINGNGLDNSIDNLRWVSHQQNMLNRKKQLNNTNFEFKGIRKSINKFYSEIRLNNIKYYIGTFHTIQECAYAYNIASKALHKEYGCLNVVVKPINYKQIKYRVYNALSKHFPEFEAKAIIYERYKNFIILYD